MSFHLALTTSLTAKAEAGDFSDQKLQSAFDRLSKGDIGALEDVYDLCIKDVYGLALWSTGSHAEASDIVQEVFLKLAKNRYSLATIQKPRNYILQITQRLGIDFFRTRQRRIKREEPIEFVEPIFIEERATHDNRIELRNAIAKLKSRQREILYLRYFAGLSFSEIAEVTGMNLFTAAGRCRLAVQRLRLLLRKKP